MVAGGVSHRNTSKSASAPAGAAALSAGISRARSGAPSKRTSVPVADATGYHPSSLRLGWLALGPMDRPVFNSLWYDINSRTACACEYCFAESIGGNRSYRSRYREDFRGANTILP